MILLEKSGPAFRCGRPAARGRRPCGRSAFLGIDPGHESTCQEVGIIPRKPADTWRRAARDAAHAYPHLKAAERDLKEVRITARIDPGPRPTGVGRSTEAAALRELPTRERAQLEAVEKALRCMGTLENSAERLQVIRLVFFGRRHTLEGAALTVPVSTGTAQRWSEDFLLLVFSYLWGTPGYALRGPSEALGARFARGVFPHAPQERL